MGKKVIEKLRTLIKQLGITNEGVCVHNRGTKMGE